jgi:hypothetical protein
MSVELSHYIDKNTHVPPKHREEDDDDDEMWDTFPSGGVGRNNSGLRLDQGEMKENPLNAGGAGQGTEASDTIRESESLKFYNKQHGHGKGKDGVHAHGHHSHFGGGHKKKHSKQVELVPKGSVTNMGQADV